MIVHVFLYKWKKHVKEEEINAIFDDLEKLRSSDGLIGMRYGEDFSGYAKGHTHALVTSFKDKDSLNKFLNNPLHKDFMHRVNKIKDANIGADFIAKR